jgi:murein L,D-transpeptidase YafK
MVLRWGNAALNRSPLVRILLVTAALVAATALAGCNTDEIAYSARSLQPLSPQMLAEIKQKNMEEESPILVRIFKQEAELEVWKQDRSGRFALLNTYPICRWSGQLGPKKKLGDRQAPEGFYTITPAQMNPESSYYLAFNIGFPNAYDRAWGRTGANLMVHGDCSSSGCYAMTDQQITEIYALARESFFGGQRAFQVQAYPFRMTPLNMAKHRNNPNMAFWKMLKRGYDHFEVTHLEPKVDVCERHYVFNAEPPPGSTRPLRFSSAGRCPAYSVQQDIAAAVSEKQRRDEYRMAQLITRGTPVAPVRTAYDGGMNRAFLVGRKDKGTMRNGAPNVQALAAATEMPERPETLPVVAIAAPEPAQVSTTGSVAADVPLPQPAPQPKSTGASGGVRALASRIGGFFVLTSDDNKVAATSDSRRVASNSPNLFGNLFSSNDKTPGRARKNSKGVFDRMGRLIGLRGGKQQAAAKTNKRRPSVPPARAARTESTAAPPRPQPEPQVQSTAAATPVESTVPPSEPAKPAANAGAIRAQPKPQPLDNDGSEPTQTASNANKSSASLVSGAAPVRPTGSFDSRWYGAN